MSRNAGGDLLRAKEEGSDGIQFEKKRDVI